MKVLQVKEHDHYCRVVFARDGHQVNKYVRLGVRLEDFVAHLQRMAAEADRDISMKTHGDLMHCEDSTLNRTAA